MVRGRRHARFHAHVRLHRTRHFDRMYASGGSEKLSREVTHNRGAGKRRAGYYPNSLIAAKCNAVGFFKPRFANSIIFSATNWVMAWSRSLNPSASHVITKAFAIA